MLKKFLHANSNINELKLFAIIFGIIFALARPLVLNENSLFGVEQWVNITNQMFYGHNDFLFSYGPVFWLTGKTVAQFSELTYWISLTFTSLLLTVFWFFIIRLSSHFSAWIPLFAVFFLYINQVVDLINASMLSAFLAVVYLECIRKGIFSTRTVILFGVAVGLMFYVRFFFGMIGAIAFGSYLFSKAISTKKLKSLIIFSLSLLLSYCVFGLIIFHNISSIKDYVLINSQLSFGNAVDMTYDNVIDANIWFCIALIVVAINVFLLFNYRTLILSFNLLLIVLVKLGFGRADHYMSYFVIPVSIVAMIACYHSNRLWWGAFIVSMAGLLYISNVRIASNYMPPPTLFTHEDFNIPVEERIARKYQDYLLPEDIVRMIGRHTIDVYPYNNEFIFANHFNYHHRPLFQNFMTLTPSLDSMNKIFLEGGDKPEFVLWHAPAGCEPESCNVFTGIDGKYILNEDPLTSTAIMLNYHVVRHFVNNHRSLVLLQRNKVSSVYHLPAEYPESAKFNQWINVPDTEEGMVKIIPDFKLSTYARVKNTLYRGDVLYIHYLMANGDVMTYRLNILNSSSGVVASTLLRDLPLKGDKVKKIKFTASSSDYFINDFKYAWSKIPVDGVKLYPQTGTILSSVDHTGQPIENQCVGSVDVSTISTNDEMRKVTLMGWIALKSADGVSAADDVFVRGMDAAGKDYFSKAKSQPRPDVAASFHNEGLVRAGYDARFILPETTGEKVLSLVALKGNTLYQCDNINYHYH